MKHIKLLLAVICLLTTSIYAQDWDGVPIPATPPSGMIWELQPVSDSFNYESSSRNLNPEFTDRWNELYINGFSGPSATSYHKDHTWVTGGYLNIHGAWDASLPIVYTGCISSKDPLAYPMYMEARVKQAGCMLANNIWMISEDETEELDMLESYPNVQEGREFLDERIHLSHHTFIRDPFTDYQPRDEEDVFGTWYFETGRSTWRDDFFTIGVYWVNPHHAQYYINGRLVRTIKKNEHNFIDPDGNLSEHTTTFDAIDKYGYTGGTGLSKPQHIIINMEQQEWLSDLNIFPTPEDLDDANDRNTFLVDWIRVYNAVPVGGAIPVTDVAISSSDLNLQAGETFDLDPVIIPSNATNQIVTWTTSNPTIAIINGSGVVTAISQGTVTAEVVTFDGSHKAVITVTVTGTGGGSTTVDVTGIIMASTNVSIDVGETTRLSATVTPPDATVKTVLWASNNPSVVTIDNLGNITGQAEGSAIITARSLNGGFTATSSITVTDSGTGGGGGTPVAVTAITTSPSRVTLDVGQTSAITATVSPSNATDKSINWSTSNAAVATVNTNGVVAARSAGSAIVTATTVDGSFTATTNVTVNNTNPPSGDDIVIEAETFTSTDGTFDDASAGGPGTGVNASPIGINYVNSGDYAEYTINVGTAGEYRITYQISTPSDNAQIQLLIDGTVVATDDVPNNGGWEDYTALVSSNTITNLSSGSHTVRIVASGSNPWQWNLDKITLSRLGGGGSPTVDGGTITGGPFVFTVGDGVVDNVSGVTLSGNVGANSQWVVTDDQRNILGLPPTPEAVDFDGAGEGTCFIYHLSYEDNTTVLATGANLSGLAGNFDLSNRIEVIRNATTPSPGDATLIIEAEDFVDTNGTFNDAFAGGPGLGVNRAGTNINYVNSGDWAEYTINVSTAGSYTIEYLISTPSDGSEIQLLLDNTVVATDDVPNNGAWESYTSLNSGSRVTLSTGSHTLRVVGSSSTIWQWNLDKIILSTGASTRDSGLTNDVPVAQLSLYPNPTNGKVFIQGLSQELENNVQVFDIKGAKYLETTLNKDHSISIENLPQGIYFLTVTNSQIGKKNLKLMKN